MVSVYATIQIQKKSLEAHAVGVEWSGTPTACKTFARNSRPKIFLQFKKVREACAQVQRFFFRLKNQLELKVSYIILLILTKSL